jgi:hypothetical protein
MPLAGRYVPSPSLAIDQTVQREITHWSVTPVVPLDVDSSSTAVKLAPSITAPPTLVPMPDRFEGSPKKRDALIPLQSWEGVVLDIGESSFDVRLVDSAGVHTDEEVSLSQDELSEFDLELLEPGAILYWTIGYRLRVGGARERVSRIRLRRLPAWTASQLSEAQERAAILARDLDW